MQGAAHGDKAPYAPELYGEGFAAVYTTSRYAVFSQRLAKLALALLKEHGASGQELLDLACGAGAGTVLFAKAGYHVSAIDGSAVMIRYAKERAQAQGITLALCEQQDMRTFRLPHQVDVTTCLFDALNYLLEDDELAQVFASVARVLRPGGLFIFDMNTPHGLATRWGTKDVVATARPTVFEVNQNRYDADSRINTTTTTVFVREDSGNLFRRYVEVHRERGYPTHRIVELLAQAGLEVASLHALADMYQGLAGGLGPLTDDAGRVVVAARRLP